MLIGSNMAFFASAGGPVAISYQSTANVESVQSTFTFSSLAIGTAAAGRYVVVGIESHNNTGGNSAISSVTVGGVSATQVVHSTTSDAASVADIWIAAVPTGTTANVVVNYSGTQPRCGVTLWRMTGSSGTAYQTKNTNSSLSQTIDVPANGGVFAAAYRRDGGTGTVSPLTTDTSFDIGSGGAGQWGINGSKTYTAAQSALSVTATISASAYCWVLASFGPAS